MTHTLLLLLSLYFRDVNRAPSVLFFLRFEDVKFLQRKCIFIEALCVILKVRVGDINKICHLLCVYDLYMLQSHYWEGANLILVFFGTATTGSKL